MAWRLDLLFIDADTASRSFANTLIDPDDDVEFPCEWFRSRRTLVFGRVIPESPGKDARTIVGRLGCTGTVPSRRDPSELKVK